MAKSAIVAPVLPGQDARSVAEMFRSRLDEYRQSRERAGITMERVYLMSTPMGEFVIAYVEADGDANEAMRWVIESDLPIDRDFVAALKSVHGIDPTQAPAGPPPEVVADWVDPQASERKQGLAFMAPIIPGKTDVARAFAAEAFVNRVAEFTESRRALGETRETVVLVSSPMGDLTAVYLEGGDPAEANRLFASSTRPYDVWFREQLATFYPPEVDFNQPLPPNAQSWDDQRATATV